MRYFGCKVATNQRCLEKIKGLHKVYGGGRLQFVESDSVVNQKFSLTLH